ncbi:nitroreductase/quinone reductase family protein [Amycolatopsis sp. NPDC050768]|uniref:nitroreductase/quinone reductase family protein n=1 Tax=Amycolatopsis sp. NPDC050768 TaxID=3154839 RepID=UPI0033F46125
MLEVLDQATTERTAMHPEARQSAPEDRGYDCAEVVRALDIGPKSGRAERTIDITTTGRRSGQLRRIEIWFHHVDGRWYLTGMPAARSWYANVLANPRFTVHLKHGVQADLLATALPVDAPTRRRVITEVLALQNRSDLGTQHAGRQILDVWLARSPLVEIVFDDERLRALSATDRP